ncbi:hypothetical protein MBUL_01169 [Methylobacterium bullatum]|uniref:DUF4160 domain-containing protein n=1 Tax=Methylobacterium bullatum TaxID=570505 RepID=A0A679IYK5_9HYPH|nr:hypothetical protein MBUL_01169 [Methylobacterium bullatum]
MPVVAIIDGIKIWFYNDDHPPPHFHAEYAEHEALIDLDTLKIIVGFLPKAQYRKVLAWAETRKPALRIAWITAQSDINPGKIP